MRTIESTTVIDAPLTEVWEVLSAGEQYAEWNPFITSVTGDLLPGARPTRPLRHRVQSRAWRA